MVLIFGVVFFILAKAGFPIITGMVDKRSEAIEKSLKDAREIEEKMTRINEESREIMDQARRELAETGSPVFDPYAPSPAGPGRPRKAAAERDTDALIRTLCESLMELLRRTEQIQK